MKLTNGKVVTSNDDEQNKTNDNPDLPSSEPKKKKKESKLRHVNKWKHSALLFIGNFEWNLPTPTLKSHEPQSSLSEKFLTDDVSSV